MKASEFVAEQRGTNFVYPLGYYLITWRPSRSKDVTLLRVYMKKEVCMYDCHTSQGPGSSRLANIPRQGTPDPDTEEIVKISKTKYHMLRRMWNHREVEKK